MTPSAFLPLGAKSFALCCLFLYVLIPLTTRAQTELDEGAMINVSNGFSVDKDSVFLLNMRFRMQNRVGLRTNSLDDLTINDIEARIRRLRLRFDGFVGNPKLQYYIQLSFSRSDQDFDNSGEARIIRDAIVYYRFNKKFYIGFGQSKLPGNRQRVTSSGNLQFADRSIANASFTLDRDFGAFAYYTGRLNNMVFNYKAAISTGEGRNVTRTDNGLAYTGRFEWLPFGSFTNSGDYSEGDLEFEPKPKLSLGVAYSYNNKTKQSGGQLGTAIDKAVDLNTFIADASFKYKGHAILAEWFNRSSSELSVVNANGNTVYITAGKALCTQYSYTFRNLWELNCRYSFVRPDGDLSGLKNQNEILLGMNKYINKHRIKVQAHIGYQSSFNPASTKEWLIGMFQVEYGI